jgi:antitoxin (DNA-binding transcriptional repressor) of toxin-antitoxin stability system
MRAVGLKILKNKLSEYVRLAAGGEVVLITDRDRVVAELSPPQLGRSPMLRDAHLADMVRDGLLVPPAIPGSVPLPAMRPLLPLAQLLAEIDADRQER